MHVVASWRAFLCDTGGNVLLSFSLAFPVLLGATGLAVDSAAFYDQQARMQSVADAAALAVASELHVYRDDLEELKAVGLARVEALLTESGIVDRPHTTVVAVDPGVNLIDVQIAMVAEGFMPPEIWGENPIRVTSQARAYGQSRLCVLALDEAQTETIKADAAAILTAPDCAVQSNSADPSGIKVAGGSRIQSAVICSSGGVDGDAGSFEPAPETDCPVLDDPLSLRAAPAVGGCDYLDREIIDETTSISPGVYCGGLFIDGTAEVTAEPGIYTMTTGPLEVRGSATLLGENVSFYFNDDNALFLFRDTADVSLSAPKDGPLAGILFYESSAAADGRAFEIKTPNARRLLGTIYLPGGILKIDTASNVAAESAYTVIVARQIDVRGANLVVNSDYGGSDVPVPDGLGPNSSMVALSR